MQTLYRRASEIKKPKPKTEAITIIHRRARRERRAQQIKNKNLRAEFMKRCSSVFLCSWGLIKK
jgi:hypothetical protein